MEKTGNTDRTDRRVIRTKKAIRNAFADLLSQKEMDAITITDIARAADINRKTFYNYYRGVHEVVDEIENETVTAFKSALMDTGEEMYDPCLIFAKLSSILNSDWKFYSCLMRNRNTSLFAKVLAALQKQFKATLTEQFPSAPEWRVDLAVSYTLSGMMTVYQQWLNSDHSRPIETFSEEVSRLVHSGISGLMQSDPKR